MSGGFFVLCAAGRLRQLSGSVFWPKEMRTFVECALSHLETPNAPSV